MKKVVFTRWFLLTALLSISISAFSFFAYRKTETIYSATKECCKRQLERGNKGEMLWDVFSRQFSSVSFQ